MQKIDYIVVGGGIAGITITHHLIMRNRNVALIVDQNKVNSSSRVAAGLFNPITGRQMVKTWKADLLFPYLRQFYKEVEEKTGAGFFHPMTIYRPFFSVEEQNDWLGKSSDPAYEDYIQQVHTKPQYPNMIQDPYGGLALKNSGWVDTGEYLDTGVAYFMTACENVQVYFEKFHASKVNVQENKVVYKKLEAQKLILCTGTELVEDPFFGWLPMNPLKGEILDINLPFNSEEIINRGVFLLPLGNKVFRAGSTYNHQDISWAPTKQGKEQLKDKIEKLVDSDFEIINHTAGIRPATKDRRPFAGIHPEYKNVAVFNGLGTKGVSLSPYFANQLIRHIEDGEPLDEQVNIQRFFSLYCN